MARALPHLLPTAGLLALACCVLGGMAGLGCNSDDRFELGPIDLTTGEVDPTEVVVFTTGEPDDTSSTGDSPPSEGTCRDGIECVLGCVVMLPMEIDPEQDYSCFTVCLDLLNTEELYELVKFVECVSGFCTETDKCSNEPGFDNSGCQDCLVNGLVAIDMPVAGCEAQTATCNE